MLNNFEATAPVAGQFFFERSLPRVLRLRAVGRAGLKSKVCLVIWTNSLFRLLCSGYGQ